MIRKFLSYLLTAPLLLAASCISEEATECPETGGKNVTLSLRLDMGLEAEADGTQSRADGEPDRYTGSASRDFEKISSLRVIILHGTDREVEGARLVATNPDGTPRKDNLEFTVKSNENKTIILIANEDALPAPEGSDKGTAKDFLDQFLTPGVKITTAQWDMLTNWTASMPTQANAEATHGFFSTEGEEYPAYGLPLTELFRVFVSTELAAQTSDDEYQQEVTLFLTRAAAKARFNFYVDDLENNPDNPYIGRGLYVTGIRLNGLDVSEYVLPKDTYYSPAKYIKNSDDIEIPNFVENAERYITSFTPVTDAEKFDFIFDISGEKDAVEIQSYVDPKTRGPIYFPESICENGSRYNVEVRIGTLTNPGQWVKAQENGTLKDNILSVGGRDAIARNTFLDINIFFGNKDITWNVSIVPYVGVTLKPSFGEILDRNNQN